MIPPRDVRRGDRNTADRANAVAALARSAGIATAQGAQLVSGRFGTTLVVPEAEGGNRIGVITTTVTACTGTSPNFTWGVGEALLLDVSASGSASTGVTVAVYSTVLTELVASDLPVQLKDVDGLLFVDVKDCP